MQLIPGCGFHHVFPPEKINAYICTDNRKKGQENEKISGEALNKRPCVKCFHLWWCRVRHGHFFGGMNAGNFARGKAAYRLKASAK